MSAAWTVVYGEEFVLPLQRYVIQIESRFKQSLPRAEVDRLCKEWDEVVAFSDAIQSVRSGAHDLPFLRSAGRYHVLKIGRWRGYYHVDPSEHLCVGLLATFDGPGKIADLAGIWDKAAQRLTPVKGAPGKK